MFADGFRDCKKARGNRRAMLGDRSSERSTNMVVSTSALDEYYGWLEYAGREIVSPPRSAHSLFDDSVKKLGMCVTLAVIRCRAGLPRAGIVASVGIPHHPPTVGAHRFCPLLRYSPVQHHGPNIVSPGKSPVRWLSEGGFLVMRRRSKQASSMPARPMPLHLLPADPPPGSPRCREHQAAHMDPSCRVHSQDRVRSLSKALSGTVSILATMTEKDEVYTSTQHDVAADTFSSKPPSSIEKQNDFNLELGTQATYITTVAAAALSQAHRDYLIKRHGTLDLDPIPSDDPADPYNWPKSKKVINLVCVAFHAFMTTFIAMELDHRQATCPGTPTAPCIVHLRRRARASR
nr:hypothetical protein CFP56_09211 [Quercus suber]